MFPLVENMLAIVGTASSYRKKYQFPLAETTFSVVRKILFTGKDTMCTNGIYGFSKEKKQ